VAKPRDVKGIHCDDSFASVAARVVRVRADELVEHSQGVQDTGEIENLHAMRVASRRLRATMEVFAPCFPRKRFRKALKEVKAIADALGERRDRDVSIRDLRHVGGSLSAAERTGIEGLVGQLQGEQSLANDHLAQFVDQRRLSDLRDSIYELTEEAEAAAR
jgi:CHAD domain-containing protein